MMSMSLLACASHKHEMLAVGGATESIFPDAEAWILSEGDHYEALQHLARRKNMEKYTSMMDFLFCELFVGYRKHCLKFYDGKGPLLKEMISDEQIAKFGKTLLGALKLAHAIFCASRRTTWINFRQEVLKIVV